MNERTSPQSAVQRAAEYGIDITLLVENLKLTPTERLNCLQQAVASAVALRDEAKRARARLITTNDH